jgi:hypothetical protein
MIRNSQMTDWDHKCFLFNMLVFEERTKSPIVPAYFSSNYLPVLHWCTLGNAFANRQFIAGLFYIKWLGY